jgi:hypothetical protein
MEEELLAILEKIKNIDLLPTQEEIKRMFLSVRNLRHNDWWGIAQDNGVNNAYSLEFVETLYTEIKKVSRTPILEICAGNGKLSYQLRKRGVPIMATDDYSWGISNGCIVEKCTHKDALTRYKPEIVIASWIPRGASIGFDVLASPSVKYFIDIGDELSEETGLPYSRYNQLHNWRKEYLESVQKNSRYECCGKNIESSVVLFTRKS